MIKLLYKPAGMLVSVRPMRTNGRKSGASVLRQKF